MVKISALYIKGTAQAAKEEHFSPYDPSFYYVPGRNIKKENFSKSYPKE